MAMLGTADLYSNILANIIGGFVAAALVTLAAYLWNLRKHKIIKELIVIMGQAIEHRNAGEKRKFIDEKEWIQKAKIIEKNVIAKAKELSSTTGSLFEWLDRVPPYDPGDEVEKYLAILSTIIARIRELMERNS